MTGILTRSGNMDADTQGEHHWKMKAETGVKYLEAKEYQGLPASRQKLGER